MCLSFLGALCGISSFQTDSVFGGVCLKFGLFTIVCTRIGDLLAGCRCIHSWQICLNLRHVSFGPSDFFLPTLDEYLSPSDDSDYVRTFHSLSGSFWGNSKSLFYHKDLVQSQLSKPETNSFRGFIFLSPEYVYDISVSSNINPRKASLFASTSKGKKLILKYSRWALSALVDLHTSEI